MSERAKAPVRLQDLYARHAPSAVRLAYLLTGDASAAEDLVQDAFVKLARRLTHLRQPSAFEWYLRRTVLNLANSHFRRLRRDRARLSRLAMMRVPPAPEADPVTRDVLRRALLRLPERQRAAIVLRFYEDLSVDQAADVLGCPPGTVKSLVSRGMEALRRDVTRGE